MSETKITKEGKPASEPPPLSFFACPNPECADFNRFADDNLSVAERMGKDKAIRRLYCKTCHTRFSERKGSLLEYTKSPQEEVVRIIKCLGHGCSMEATADICQVDPRTVQRLLERAGQRAENFHNLQMEKLAEPLEAVEMDELHGRASDDAVSSKALSDAKKNLPDRVAHWVASGFMRRWP